MDDLEQLYQEIILDHYKHPRNAELLAGDVVQADEENPMCGDRIQLSCQVKEGQIESVRYDVQGCAVSRASASMMSEALQGLPVEQARELIQSFIAAMRGEQELNPAWHEDLMALSGVRKFPLRVKCATLAWHGLAKALDKGAS